jgi:lipopolysaccharide/colanic/teichoic acid biosynthesis glycosyltransferase/glycosyltransferase involved in cell wall biosynthesis
VGEAPARTDGALPRVAHLTTIDMSLELLLGPELVADRAAGFDVVGISAPGPYVEAVESRGVRHVPVSFTRSWRPRHDLRAARELLATLRRLELDVLHTHTPKAGVLGRVLGRLAGIPVVVNTCHGLWTQRGDPAVKQALVLAAETVAGWCSDAELYQNDEDRRRMRWLIGRARQRTVGNGVDLGRFAPDDEARGKLRAEFGVADDEVLVGGVGRRVAEKGIAEFAAAARVLGHRARFVWVGPDEPDKSDRLRALEDGVEFLGARHDMPAVYNALDVFALPSYREGLSRSAMEAAACGCAVVVTDIRGCREIGEPGREVLRVPPRDATALSAAIERLLDEPRLRARLAESARSRASQAFDQRRVAEASIATYHAVARRKRLPWAAAPSTVPPPDMTRHPTSEAAAPTEQSVDLRRAVDVVVSAAALVAAAPVLLAVAAAVRLKVGRGVLFRQARAGLHGDDFTIYKFRTMRPPRHPGETDADRMTRLGALLRATSLDELPQLVNVLKGDMSLIGPRPTLPEQVAHYDDRQRLRLSVRPGLTGYAQVKGRNALSWPERIELDLVYLRRRSLRLDLWIVARTVRQLLRPEGVTGAGGVNPGFPIPGDEDGRTT